MVKRGHATVSAPVAVGGLCHGQMIGTSSTHVPHSHLSVSSTAGGRHVDTVTPGEILEEKYSQTITDKELYFALLYLTLHYFNCLESE